MINPPTTEKTFSLHLDNDEAREKVRDHVCGSSVAAYLNKITDDYYQNDNTPDRSRQKDRTERFRRYFQSDNNGEVKNGEYNDLTGIGDEYFADPKINTYLASILPQLLQAQTRFLVKPKSSNEIKYRRVAEFLQKGYEEWLVKTNTINKRQREIKWNLLASGDTYRFMFYNEKRIAKMIDVPVTEKEQIKTSKKGKWACPNCTANGALSDLDVKILESDAIICPQCKYEQVKVQPDVSVDVEMDTEYKRVPMCDFDFEVPDASEITVIWSDDEIENALAVIWTRNIPRCLVEEAFPGKTIPYGNTEDDSTPEYLANNQDLGEIDTNTQKIRVQRVWLNPSVYAGAKTSKEETITIDDKKTLSVPAKAKILKELFQRGLYFVRAGAKTILQTYEQAIGDCWTHTVNEISKTGYGIGEWDLLEQQYQKNEARTQRMQKLINDSSEPIIERDGYIDDIPNRHGARVKVRDLGANLSFSDIISRVPKATFPAEAVEMERQLDGDMQARIGAMSTSAGDMPDMEAVKGTATGFRQWQNHTMERRRPLLEMMAENLDKKQFYQYWQMFKSYQSEAATEQYFDKTPSEVIEWFFEMDIHHDFEVIVVPNSYMPETKEQKQAKTINYFNALSMVRGLYQDDPKKLQAAEAEITALFDGIGFEEQSEEQTEAQLRLDKVIEAAQKLEKGQRHLGVGVTDANGFVSMELVNTALAQATKLCKTLQTPADPFPDKPIDVLLDEHEEIIDVYQDYLRSSNGRNLSQFVRAVIKVLIVVHSQAAPQKEIYVNNLYNQITSAQTDFQLAEQRKVQEEQLRMSEEADTVTQARQQDAATNELLNEVLTNKVRSEQELQHAEEKGEQDLKYKLAGKVLQNG